MVLIVIDVRKEKERAEQRYRDAVALADECFGKDSRVYAEGRGISGICNKIYIGSIEKPSIEIMLSNFGSTIRVHGESKLAEARDFAERYNRMFKNEQVFLEHNLR